MRIISQDGLREMQYESCGLAVNPKCCEIEAYTSYTDFTPVMASYGSVEKCRKAMEMLRKAYSPLLIIKDLGDGIEADIKPNDWRISVPEPLKRDNFYFQFPADSEIEV